MKTPARGTRLGPRARIADEGGQALVELAMTGLLLIVLALGVADFGVVLRDYLAVVNAASAGATAAARDENAAAAALTASGNWDCLESGGLPKVTVSPASGKTTVTVKCTVKDLTGYFGPLTLEHSATSRKRPSP